MNFSIIFYRERNCYIGSTIKKGLWEIKHNIIELEIEDSKHTYDNCNLTITTIVGELFYTRLYNAIQSNSESSKQGSFWSTSCTEPEIFSVLLVAEKDNGIYHQFVIYTAISQEGVSLSFSKSNGNTYEMTCRGLVDAGRDKDDMLGYAYITDIPE